eukprot:1159461-Pelagomonas_calceolata.AAC.5
MPRTCLDSQHAPVARCTSQQLPTNSSQAHTIISSALQQLSPSLPVAHRSPQGLPASSSKVHTISHALHSPRVLQCRSQCGRALLLEGRLEGGLGR